MTRILVLAAAACLFPTLAGSSELASSTYLGGERGDEIMAVAVDGAGSAYLAGSSSSECFHATAGALDHVEAYSGFVTKLDPTGAVAWTARIGGCRPLGLDLAPSGDITVVGESHDGTFPVVAAMQAERTPGEFEVDAVVFQIDATGSSLRFATYLGGVGHDPAVAVDHDAAGRVVLAGQRRNLHAPPDEPPREDSYVARLSADGQRVEWTFPLAGSQTDLAGAVAVAPSGDVLVGGRSMSPDFGWTGGTGCAVSAGGFVARIAADGSGIVWNRCYEAIDDHVTDLVLDPLGGGWAASATADHFPEEGEGPWPNAAVVRFDANGALQWRAAIPATGYVWTRSIDAASDGTVVVAGWTGARDIAAVDAFQPGYAGGTFDAFVARFGPDGTASTVSYLGGSRPAALGTPVDMATSVALLPDGSALLGGITNSADFPWVDPLPAQAGCVPSAGPSDAFVARVSFVQPQVQEPSAVDLRPWARPLTVGGGRAGLIVTWEETVGEKYALYVGTLESILRTRAYDHVPFSPCSFSVPPARIEPPAGNVYFLATSRAGTEESSYGRDSLRRERPPARAPCP